MLDEVQQPRIRPLQVFEHEDHRLMLGEPLEEQPPAGEQLLATQAGLRHADQRAQPRRQELAVGGVGDPAVKPRVEFRRRLERRRVLGDPEPLADHLA